MTDDTATRDPADRTPRTWIHARKGKLTGYVASTATTSEGATWMDIVLTEDGCDYAGAVITVRESFLTEVTEHE